MNLPNPTPGLQALRTILRRRWPVALISFGLPAALAAGLVVYLPNIYQARAVVLVEPTPVPDGKIDDTEVRLQQLTQENLSRPRLAKLLPQLGLAVANGGAPTIDDARRDIDVTPVKAEASGSQTSVAIHVSVRGRDPARAAQAANALASFYVDTERERLRAEAEGLAARVEELRTRFEKEQEQIIAYQERHLKELPAAVGVNVATVGGLTAELEMINVNKSRALERARALTRRSGSAPSADAADPDPELTRLRRNLRELSARYTDEHPDVMGARRELALAEAQRAGATRAPAGAPRAESRDELRDLDAELKATTRAEAGVKGRIAGALDSAFKAPRRQQELAALLPRYEAARAAYEMALKQQEEVRLVHGDRNPFRVVEQAVVPAVPVGPDRPRLAMLGGIFAILVAGAAVWVARQTDHGLHSVADLKALVRIPILASIPRIATVGETRRRRLRAAGITLLSVLAMAAIFVAARQFVPDNDTLLRLMVRKGAP
jgi:protein tyrosine kinase modulator